jgi:predicted XRE-type DNA-binding protein
MRARSRKPATHRRITINVYADLGYHAPESMRAKAQLVSRVAELLAERGMTETEVATLLGISQPKLSKVFRGQFRRLPLCKLMECLTQLVRGCNSFCEKGRINPSFDDALFAPYSV